MSGAGIRTDAELKKMTCDEQRNVAIVEIGSQTNLGQKLKDLTNIDLVLTAFGVDPVFKPMVPPLSDPVNPSHVPPGEPDNPELGDKTGSGDDKNKQGTPMEPPPEHDNEPPPTEGPGCFTRAMPVWMADGLTKTIDAIAIGDRVIARDEETGLTAVGAVDRVFRHRVVETLLLQTDGAELVETTAEHRFAAKERGFVNAGRLRPGDKLSTHSENDAEVVATVARTAEVTVYNLSVDPFHTFFIGGAKLWVHNLKKSDPSDPPIKP